MNVIVVDTKNWDELVGNTDTTDLTIEGVIAHELQHLLHNYSDPGELSWVDEGLADFSIFLNGYPTGGSHSTYHQVFHRETSLTRWGGGLENYGASFSFFQYVWEQAGGNGGGNLEPDQVYSGRAGDRLIKLIFENPLDGMAGIQAAIDQFNALPGEHSRSAEELFKDWAVTVYLDDEASPRWNINAFDFGDPATTRGRSRWPTTSTGAAATSSRAPCRRPSGATATSAALTGDLTALPYGTSYQTYRNPGSRFRVNLDGADSTQIAPHTGTTHWYAGYQSQFDSILNVDSPVAGGQTLDFWSWHFIEEGWDYGFVEALVNGQWRTVPLRNDAGQIVTTNDNPQGNNTEGNGLTGTSGGEYFVDDPAVHPSQPRRCRRAPPTSASATRRTLPIWTRAGSSTTSASTTRPPRSPRPRATGSRRPASRTITGRCRSSPRATSTAPSTANETTDGAGNYVYRFDGDDDHHAVFTGKCKGGIVTVISNLPTGDLQFLDAPYEYTLVSNPKEFAARGRSLRPAALRCVRPLSSCLVGPCAARFTVRCPRWGGFTRQEGDMRRRGLTGRAGSAGDRWRSGAPTAQADEALKMYRVTVDEESVGRAQRARRRPRPHRLSALAEDRPRRSSSTYSTARRAPCARDGLDAARGDARARTSSESAARAAARAPPTARAARTPSRRRAAIRPTRSMTSSAPTPSRAASRTRWRASPSPDPGLAKLVVIGKTGQGQDIVALKVTKDARNVTDGARPAMLFSAVNHAREWIAAEVGRRMPTWWLEHADDPADRRAAEPQRAVVPADPEPGRLRLHVHLRHRLPYLGQRDVRRDAGDRPERPAARYLRLQDRRRHRPRAQQRTAGPRTAQADQPAVAQDPARQRRQRRRSATARTASTRTATTPRRGASTTRARATRPPAAPTAARSRSRRPRTSRTTDSCAGSRPRRSSTTTPRRSCCCTRSATSPTSTPTTTRGSRRSRARTATRRSTRTSRSARPTSTSPTARRPTTRTTSTASMAWTPELDECETAAGGTFCTGGSGFTFPDDESKVEAVFQKNLDFARNVAATTLDRDRPDRPRNATDDETQYQVKASPDIEPNRFNVSYGADADARGHDPPHPRPGRLRRPGRHGPRRQRRARSRCAAQPWRGGERFGDLRGKYYQRVRAQIPADFVQPGTAQAARPLVAGDVVNVRVIAGSQQQRFSYRVVSTRPAGAAKRVLVVAAEDYTGLSPNKTPYAAAPRYLDEHVAALQANGYSGRDARRRQPARRARTAWPPSKQLSDLGVLVALRRRPVLHGRRPAPAGRRAGRRPHELPPRRHPAANGTYSLTGSQHLTTSGVRNAQMLRNYMNEGGKVVFSGRNGWVQQTEHEHHPEHVLGLQLVAGARLRVQLPAEPDRGRRPPAHGVLPRAGHLQRLGPVVARRRRRARAGRAPRPTTRPRSSPARAACSTACRRSRSTRPPGAGESSSRPRTRPRASPEPRLKSPTGCATISSVYHAASVPPGARGGRLRRADDRQRRRDHLDARFRVAGLRPRAGHRRRRPDGARAPHDGAPAADDRRHRGPDGLVAAARRQRRGQRRGPGGDRGRGGRRARRPQGGPPAASAISWSSGRCSFPFQFRWQPSAGYVGQTVTLSWSAEDKAGNVTRSFRVIRVVSGSGIANAPLPTGVTTIAGTPAVGETLTCIPSGFTGDNVTLSYQWLRDGAAIGGATSLHVRAGRGRRGDGRELPCQRDQQRGHGRLHVERADHQWRHAGDGARAASGADNAGRRHHAGRGRSAAANRLRDPQLRRPVHAEGDPAVDQGDDPCRRAQAARHGQRPRHGSRTAEGQEGQAHGARRGPLHRGHVDREDRRPARPDGHGRHQALTPITRGCLEGQPRVPYLRWA